MNAYEFIGIAGIIIALLAFVYVTIKGVNTIIGAPIVTIIIIVFNKMHVMDSLFGQKDSYVSALANFILANFSIFLLGAVLAKYMEKSGATQSIANKILYYTHTDRPYSVLLAIFIISSIITMGGVSFFVVCFALIPMAKPLFKELNIAWNLVTIPLFAGMATYTMSMLPGSPSIVNVIPANALHTTLTAAPILGIICSIFIVAYSLIYMYYELKKSQKRGETYSTFVDVKEDVSIAQGMLPNFLPSILPMITLLLIIIIFRDVSNIILIALTASILLCALLFRKQVNDHVKILNQGALDSVIPVFSTSSTVAFGTVLASSSAFEVIKSLIMTIPGNPLISLSISTAILSCITGSAAGTVGIVMQSFAADYVAMGIDPQIIHRITTIASASFGIMPYTGLCITFNTLAKLSLKQSFRYQFFVVSIGHILTLILALTLVTFVLA